MQIYNTLTRKKEEFIPQKEGEYRIYVCGPTVYNYIHIGNARPVVVFDTLRRYLEYRGNKVYFVSNITDIDDKLIKKAQEQGCSMKEVAEKFEAEFIKDSDGLNAKTPTVRPRATEHIEEILDIVKDILDKGYGYVAKNGDVYFRTRAFKEYGKLSHLNLEELESGNRELRSQMDDDLKEDPADFAVWKAAKPGEPAWPSPYGPGRPGWHIECSASPVRVRQRLHLQPLLDAQRLFEHRQPQDEQERQQLLHRARDRRSVRLRAHPLLPAHRRLPHNAKGESNLLAEKAAAAKVKFNTAMDDDLNTPDALAAVFELVKDINTLGADASVDALKAAATTFDELTGVLGLLYNRKTDEIPAEVMDLVSQRAEAKKAKDWPTADALRAKITEMGYVVEDTPQGPKVTRA